MSQFPNSRVDDPDDVADALEVARTQWNRGDRPEALKWLRKAADTAFDQGFDERGLELSKTAADLSSNPPPMPSQNAPPATAPPPSNADTTASRRSVPPGRRTSRNPREPSPRPQGFRPDARGAPAPSPPSPTTPPSRARPGAPPSPSSKSPPPSAPRTGASSRPAPFNTKGSSRAEEIPPGDLFAQSIDEFVEESSHPSIPIEETTEIVSLSNFERLEPPKPAPPKPSAPAPATTTAPTAATASATTTPMRVQTAAQPATTPATAKSSGAPPRTYGAPVSKPSSPAVQAVASARASQGVSSAPGRAPQTVSRAPSATTSTHAAPVAAATPAPATPAPVTPTPAQPKALQALRVALTKGPGGVQWRLLDDHGLRAGETEVLVVATSADVDLAALLG